MAQIKIYALRKTWQSQRAALSDTIHACTTEALQLPPGKKFHRFLWMERADFLFPPERSDAYIILEISIFEGRTTETKKQLIHLLFERLQRALGIAPNDLEITIFETPRHNWGIRGQCGDELQLPYRVDV